MAVDKLRNPFNTVVLVITQEMGARYKAGTVSELYTKIVRDKSSQNCLI
jgi:hypothetical protein